MIRVVTNEVKLKSNSALRKPREPAPRDAAAGGPLGRTPPGRVAPGGVPPAPNPPGPGPPAAWLPGPAAGVQIGLVGMPAPAGPGWRGVPGAGRAAPAPLPWPP